jgi:hypothetical protein
MDNATIYQTRCGAREKKVSDPFCREPALRVLRTKGVGHLFSADCFIDVASDSFRRGVGARRGASIIEVMFAVGVLLFGLIGMAALIPAAGKLARNSIDFDRGAAIGQTVSAEFEARGYGTVSRWMMVSDAAASGTIMPAPIGGGGIPAPVAIDPLFVSRPENFVTPTTTVGLGRGFYEPASLGNHNYFRRNLFPYYTNNYNPLVDPRNEIGSNDWPAMPRLNRVAIANVGTTRSSGTPGSLIPSTLSAGKVADDVDQLVFDKPEDKTLPVSQVLRTGSGAASAADFPIPAVRSGRPEYSWFATVQPRGSRYATLNTVVVRSRDRTFETPPSGTPPANDPFNPLKVSERVAWVSGSLSGNFVGGAGGTVTLTASQAIDSGLSTDGWVMLIRNAPVGQVHAWYRIVHADRDATLTTVVDPNGGNKAVWQRNVTLEGSDWNFGIGGPLANQTLAVLVDGVVSVTETSIHLQP